MGLDMYLNRKNYIGNKWRKKDTLVRVVVPKNQAGKIDNKKISYITEEVGYWRKANAIHKWFVQNVQGGEDDCEPHYVSREDLEKLLSVCKTVLEKSELVEGKIEDGYTIEKGKRIPNIVEGKYIKDPSTAEKLLPTTSGFFFGGTGYDEYYIKDIEDTIKIIEDVLNDKNQEGEIYYESSW